jgi:hypothetical protein
MDGDGGDWMVVVVVVVVTMTTTTTTLGIRSTFSCFFEIDGIWIFL